MDILRQANNRRNSRPLIECDGVMDSVAGIAAKLGTSGSVIDRWMGRGYSAQQIADQYRALNGKISYLGLFPDWCPDFGSFW